MNMILKWCKFYTKKKYIKKWNSDIIIHSESEHLMDKLMSTGKPNKIQVKLIKSTLSFHLIFCLPIGNHVKMSCHHDFVH